MKTATRILLVMPKHRDGDRTFPYGIASIYSTLKENGYEVDLADCVVTGKDLPDLVPPEALRKYDLVGIGGLISAYQRVKREVVPYVRAHAPGAMIVIGGYLGTSIPERLLHNRLADVVFRGDGEESILEFLEVRDDRKAWKKVVGLAYLGADGTVVTTGVRIVSNLEKAYVPYYQHIDIAQYNAHLPERNRFYPLVVEAGCPFRCNFCFNSVGNKPRARSPEQVIAEIKEAIRRYRPPEIWMMSENLLSHPKWVRRFCELIDEHRLSFRWSAAGHANAINDEMLRLVKRHGCTKIGIGFENFSQTILDNMNKHTQVAKYEAVLRLLRRHNLDFSGTMIFGYFGENDRTIEENVSFCRKMLYAPQYYWIQAYPLTKLYDECMQRGLITDEERYLEGLGDNTDFVLNLTDFPTDTLKRKREEMHAAIRLKRLSPRRYARALRLYGVGFVAQSVRSGVRRVAGKVRGEVMSRLGF